MDRVGFYFIAAYRSLKKYWFSSLLSLLGLAAAFSLCLISGLMIWKAYSSDGHWKNASQIYVLSRPVGGGTYVLPRGFLHDVQTFSPDILNVSAQGGRSISYKMGDKKNALWAHNLGDNFLSMFELKAASGRFESLMERENMVALATWVATSVYGDEDPIGQTFETSKDDIVKHYTVGATYASDNTTLIRARILIRDLSGSDDPYSQIFLELKEGTDTQDLFERLNTLLIEKYPDRRRPNSAPLKLTPLKGAMINLIYREDTRVRYLGLFYSSVLMLLIAFLNYISLTTASTAMRSRDIAMRKILGANRSELTLAFIVEMLLLVSLAYSIALGVATLISPYFSTLTQPWGSNFNANGFSIFSRENAIILVWGWIIALSFGLIASLYPIWSMVRSKVVDTLRRSQSSYSIGGSKLRFMLLSLQSLAGFGLTLMSGIIYFQITSLENTDRGFDSRNLLYIHMWGEQNDARRSADAIVSALKQVDGVENAVLLYTALPLHLKISPQSFIHPISGEPAKVPTMWVGDYFIETMKMSLKTGRIPLAPEPPAEGEPVPEFENVFVNERFVRDYQMGDANEILGKCLIYIFSGKREDQCRRITAVVGNHYQNLDENPVSPVVFIPGRGDGFYNIMVRYDPTTIKDTFKNIEKVWDGFTSGQEIYYHYLDNLIAKKLIAKMVIAKLLIIIATGSLFLTVAGLYAMAKFVVARRGREIAIRRVLGAKTGDIVKLVVVQLAKPIIFGACIGLPIGWYYAMDWLTAYSIRIEPEPWHAVMVGLFGVTFFILTATSEILRAVRIRPAEALHCE